MTLEKYQAKRNFDKTAEPRGDGKVAPSKRKGSAFPSAIRACPLIYATIA